MAPNLYTPVIQRPYRIYLGSPARPLCSSDYNESFQWKHLRPSITFVPSFSSSDRGQAELLVKLMGRSKDKRPPSANRWRFEQCRDPLGIGRKRPVWRVGHFLYLLLSFRFVLESRERRLFAESEECCLTEKGQIQLLWSVWWTTGVVWIKRFT